MKNAVSKTTDKQNKLVAGLCSGTSVDSIDAALVNIAGAGMTTSIELVSTSNYPYPPNIREQLIEVSIPGNGSVDRICRLNVAVGECFARAAIALAEKSNTALERIDLIGSHGQTIHHLPSSEPIESIPTRGTLQIGEPSVIAKRTGILTIADFRHADMALGGQGAPLTPIMDYLLFRSPEKVRGLLNLGGIANLTFLKKNGTRDEVAAFDTGPANMVIDGLMQRLFNRPFDENGEIATRGSVSQKLLSRLLEHPYFSRPLPKSTGREEFGEAFVEQTLRLAKEHQLNSEDLIATATALTAESIFKGAESLRSDHDRIEELIVSGGGAHNLALMTALRERFSPASVSTTDDYGIPVDFKEAILFALLANETISGNPGNVPSVTGARAATVLGKICV